MNIITDDNHNSNHNLSTPNKTLNLNSLYFQQFIQSSPQFQTTDKNKLFEAFLLFQNILNLNKHSTITNTNHTLPLTAASSTAKTFDSTIKSEHPPEITNEPLVKKELLFLSTEKKSSKSKDKQTITKYDDLPIKISNSNYIETIESKRKFTKSNRNKTTLNLANTNNNNNKQHSTNTNNDDVHKQHNKHIKTFKSSFVKDEPKVTYEQQLEQDIGIINNEINKFKDERKKICILKNEYEKLYLRLQEDFEQLNVKEKEFEMYREIESNKIKTKQKAIDECLKLCNDMKSQNCNLSINAKRDKEQINALNEQISNMRNEYKQKEINNKIIIDKLKKQNEELQKQLQLHLTKHNEVTVSNKMLIQQNENEEEEGMDNTMRVNNIHNPILSYSNNIINNEVKIRKLMNKQLTSSNIYNNNKHHKPNTLYYTKHKNNTSSYHNSSSLTNINSSYNKPKHIYNKHSLSTSNKNSLSSLTTAPLTSTLPKPKPKPHNTSNNNTIIFSYNSLHPKHNSKSFTHSQSQSQINIDIIQHINNNNIYNFTFPLSHSHTLIKSTTTSEGKTINTYTNNKKEIIYQSGIRKEIYNNTYQIIYFINGDIKQIFPNGVSVYYFNEEQTIQTIFKNGLQVFKYQNGQIEKHYPDGTKYITFPDNTTRYVAKEVNDE